MQTILTPQKPYVGPYPIEYGQPFFGREVETADLASRLVARRIVLLHAPSGAGKTSLIQAGLIPALEQQSFLTLHTIRVNRLAPPGKLTAGCCNRFIFSTLMSLEEGLPHDHQTPLNELADVHLGDYLESHRELYAEHSPNPNARRTLLIFDQFEEILTTEATNRKLKEEFFGELMAILLDNRYWFLFAIREEYLARLEPYLSYFPDRLSAHFGLDFLNPEAAREAIQKPTQLFKVAFQDDAADKLVEDLRQIRQQDENGQIILAAGPTIEPVQLQVVCSYLWDAPRPDPGQITLEDVKKWADVDNALALYYAGQVSTIAQETGVPERLLRKWFEERLITPGGLRIQVLAGLERDYKLSPQSVQKLIDAFLIRGETRRGATWYELSHDRLVQPILDNNKAWFRANLSLLQLRFEEWLKNGRQPEQLLVGRDLRDATTWAKSHMAELTLEEQEYLAESQSAYELRGRAVRTRRVMAILGVILVGISILTILAFLGARRNQIQADQTSRSLATLYGEASKAISQPEELERKLVTAVHALEVTEWRGQEDTNAARQAIYDALRVTGGIRYQASTYGDSTAINPLNSVVLSPDGRWLAAAGRQPPLSLWDLQAGTPTQQPIELVGQVNPILTLAIHPQGRYLAGGSLDGSLLLWNLAQPTAGPRILHPPGGQINAIAFSPDGRWLAAGSKVPPDRQDFKSDLLLLWDLSCPSIPKPLQPDLGRIYPTPSEGEQIDQNLRILEDTVTDLAFSSDSRWLVAAGAHDPTLADPTTALLAAWRVDDLPNCSNKAPDTQITSLPMPEIDSPGEGTQATADSVSPVEENQDLPYLANLEGAFTSLAISSPTDQENYYIVSGGDNGAVRLWQLTPQGRLKGGLILGKHNDPVNDLAFDRESTRLASASTDDQIFYWNQSDLEFILSDPEQNPLIPGVLSGHQDDIKSIRFSPDGRWLYSASSDHTLRAWDFESGDPGLNPIVLYAHQGAINALDNSASPDRLASASEDGTLRVWDLLGDNPATQPFTNSLPQAAQSRLASNPEWSLIFDETSSQGLLFDLEDFSQENKPISQSFTIPVPDELQIDLVASHEEGRWLAATGSLPQDGDYGYGLLLWKVDKDVPSAQLMPIQFLDTMTAKLDFAPSGDWLVTRDVDDQPTLWRLEEGDMYSLPLETAGEPIASVAFNTNERWLAAGGYGGKLFVWDLEQIENRRQPEISLSGSPLHVVEISETGPLCALAFRPERDLLAIAGADDTIYTWRARTPGAEAGVLEAFEPALEGWRTKLGLEQVSIDENSSSLDGDPCLERPNRLVFSPDGRWLATTIEALNPEGVGGGSSIGLVILADLGRLDEHPARIAQFYLQDFWADLHLGDLPDEAWILPDPLGKITALTFSPDGNWLAVGDDNGPDSAVRLWRTSNPGSNPIQLGDPQDAISGITFSSDDRWLLSESLDGFVRVWAIQASDLIQMSCQTLGRQLDVDEIQTLLPAEDWQETWEEFCNQ